MIDSDKCPGCGMIIGDSTGECGIFGSHDIPDLCEPCYLAEDDLIEQEGTNSPEHSDAIKKRLEGYRALMKAEGIPHAN